MVVVVGLRERRGEGRNQGEEKVGEMIGGKGPRNGTNNN